MNTSLHFSEGETDMLKLFKTPYAQEGLNYTRYSRPVLQNRTLFMSVAFRGHSGKKLLPQTELTTFIQFYSPLLTAKVNGPLTESAYKVIGRPSSAITLGSQFLLFSGKNMSFIKTNIRLGFQEAFFQTGSSITKFRNGLFHAELFAERQVFSKIRLNIYAGIDYRFFSSNQIIRQIEAPKNLLFKKEIKIAWQFSEFGLLEWKSFAVVNNLRTITPTKTFFSEMKFSYKISKTCSFYSEVMNLFNLRSLVISDQNQGYLQSSLSVPIMPFHFLLGARWIF